MTALAIVENALGASDLELIDRVRVAYPGYVSGAHGLPPGRRLAPIDLAVGRPRLSYASELAGRADAARYRRRLEAHARSLGEQVRPLGHSSYLRGSYVLQGRPRLKGAEKILETESLLEAARASFGPSRLVPYTVYANVYLPGQELHSHTDIPAFRGAELGQLPPWLLVVMHHSGLFERWRVPIATVIAHPLACASAGFTYFSTSPNEAKLTVNPPPSSVVALDADTIFHRVEQVAGETELLGEAHRGAYLIAASPQLWELWREGDRRALGSFQSDEIRYTVSWKALSFEDDRAYRRWAEHSDDLDLGLVVPTLTAALGERGLLAGAAEKRSEAELAGIMIDAFVSFPPPGA